MEKKLLKAALGGLLLLAGCNNVPTRSDLVATVGGAPVSREDALFALSSTGKRANDSASRFQALYNLLDNRQKAEIARRHLGNAQNEIEAELRLFENRNLAQIYNYFHLRENLGIPRDTLENYFRLNRQHYMADSLVDTTFYALRQRVAEDYYIKSHGTDIEAMYREKAGEFKSPDQARAAVLIGVDSNEVASRLARLAAGANVDSVLLTNGKGLAAGDPALVQMNSANANGKLMGLQPLWSYAFGEKATPAGHATPVFAHVGKGQKFYAALWIIDRKPAYLPPLDSVRAQVEKKFVAVRRHEMSTGVPERLRVQYAVKLAAMEPEGVESYYAAHSAEFKTLPGYRLYHLEMSDSAQLAAALTGVTTLEAMQAKASLGSNSYTAAHKGEIGLVKEGHCLPYGIGMMPDLFDKLTSMKPGTFTGILKAPDTDKYHVFYLAEKVSPQVKPLERVRKQIEAQLKGSDRVLDSNTVLAYLGNEPIVRESEVMRLKAQIPAQQQAMYNREALVEILVNWYLMASEARRAGLDKAPEYRSWTSMMRDQMMVARLQDSLLAGSLGVPEADLKKAYAGQQGKLFVKPYAESRLEAALWLRIPDIAYRMAFAIDSIRYAPSKDWKEARPALFKDIKGHELALAQQVALVKLQQEVPIRILDSAFQIVLPSFDKQTLIEKAKKAYEERNLELSRQNWLLVRHLVSGDEASLSMATMELAKIYNEQEQFEASAREYGVYAALWPKASDAYKAMFMRGFILSENLKRDSVALPVFQDMLKRYPHTDLSDDAEWMVRNIQSGGKMVPALLDSISRADQAATASEASTAPATPDAPVSPQGAQPAAPPAAKP